MMTGLNFKDQASKPLLDNDTILRRGPLRSSPDTPVAQQQKYIFPSKVILIASQPRFSFSSLFSAWLDLCEIFMCKQRGSDCHERSIETLEAIANQTDQTFVPKGHKETGTQQRWTSLVIRSRVAVVYNCYISQIGNIFKCPRFEIDRHCILPVLFFLTPSFLIRNRQPTASIFFQRSLVSKLQLHPRYPECRFPNWAWAGEVDAMSTPWWKRGRTAHGDSTSIPCI